MSELAKALVEAQKAMPEVPKTAKANYGKYATLDDLIAKTRPILNANGLSIQQFPHVSDLGQPVLRTIVRHVSGESEQADTPLFMQKQDMQALGAAITYARRYAWGAVLGIASEHDDDAQSIVADPKPAREAGSAQHKPSPAAAPSAPTFKAPDGAATAASGTLNDAATVRVHFGKNANKLLSELAPKQREWYAADGWADLVTSKGNLPSEADRRVREAARVLCGLDPHETTGPFAYDSDVPF